MTAKEGKEYLKTVIVEQTRHRDYDRVVDLAIDYKKYYTGEGLESFIREIYKIDVPPEQITSIIPPILKSTEYPFNKVFRAKPVSRLIDFEGDEVEDRIARLEEDIDRYYEQRSLESYLQYVLVKYNYIDPNAWIVTEFDQFDPKKEKAKPYPFLVLSEEAIDYKLNNGIPEYLTVKQVVDRKERYTLYLENDTLVYQEGDVGEDIAGKKFEFFAFKPKGGQVPAVRIGVEKDIETRGRTFVALYEKVVPFLKKIIKVDYEGDMSMGDLAFPKRYEYVDDCNAEGCNRGHLPDGSKCSVCNGTGKTQAHRTATDIREFTLPRDKDEMLPLNNMTFTDFPPVEGLKLQQDIKDKWKNQVFSFMFNAEIFDKTQVTATATEKNIQMDNLNDAVMPIAKLYERVWSGIVKQIAAFTDNANGLIVSLVMPTDYKFKSLTELMSELSAARQANASIPTIAAIEDDINEMLYSDRPQDLKKIRIKNSLNPFMGYTEEMVRVIISQGLTTKINEVLYSNLESIMNELELDYLDPWIYDLNIEKINELVRAKAQEMIDKMAAEKPKVEPFNPFSDENRDETEDGTT
jgi:hypothetical protein